MIPDSSTSHSSTPDCGNENSSCESSICDKAREVLAIESEAIARLGARLDDRFERAVQLVLECEGRVVVTGVGKSGAIGRKLSATFASTGTPSLFLHAAEGLHGDLGMVAPGDVLVAISYSGRTDDLVGILPVIKAMEVPIIALTGNATSFLGSHADVILDISVEKEACPLNLAPTASTTAALAMGDALAVCAMSARHFTSEDFARFHPGGTLGRGLTLRVSDLMRTGERLALVPETATLRQAIVAITEAMSGSVLVTTTTTNAPGVLCGYLTDGDVRRLLVHTRDAEQLLKSPVAQFMTRTPLSLSPRMLALEALRALQERGVDDAPVVDEAGAPAGVLDVQELLRAGLV
jgi:arabinose-5-phosphate isomerase